MSARLRLTLSYAGFLLLAGAAVLAGVYVVLRFVPNYPLTAANPRDPGGAGSHIQFKWDQTITQDRI